MRILSASFLFLFPLLSFAGKVDIKVTLITFGMETGSFNIVSNDVRGSLSKKGNMLIAQNIRLNLKSLKSGIEERDKHIRESFDVERFPEAVVVKGVAKDKKFLGILKIKNRPVKGEGTYSEGGGIAKGSFKVKMSDFGIVPKPKMGIKVKDEVVVSIEMPLPKS